MTRSARPDTRIGDLLARSADVRAVLEAAHRELGATLAGLRGPGQDRFAVGVRAAVAYALRHLGLSYSEIGHIINRDHTSVIYLVLKAEKDECLRSAATDLLRAVWQSVPERPMGPADVNRLFKTIRAAVARRFEVSTVEPQRTPAAAAVMAGVAARLGLTPGMACGLWGISPQEYARLMRSLERDWSLRNLAASLAEAVRAEIGWPSGPGGVRPAEVVTAVYRS